MKKVLEAAERLQENLGGAPRALALLIAQLGATIPERRQASQQKLLDAAEGDVEDAEGRGEAAVAAARIRYSVALERAGRADVARQQIDEAASEVGERGVRDALRFRVHIALMERALARGDRPEAEKQLGFARDHVPLNEETEERPHEDFVLDLAMATARCGSVDDAVALLTAMPAAARHGVLADLLMQVAFEARDASWAAPFLAKLVPLAREEDGDPFARAARCTGVARALVGVGSVAEAKEALAGLAASLGDHDGDEDPELDMFRADLAEACAAAGLFDDALALIAPIPEGPNLAVSMMHAMGKAGAPWRARAVELARAAERPAEAFLELATGDVERGAVEDAKAAIAEAEKDGFADSEWGTVARVLARAGDAAGARAAAEHLRDAEIDPVRQIEVDMAAQGAEAAGLPDLAESILVIALDALGEPTDDPLPRPPDELAAGVIAMALDLAEQRAAAAKPPAAAATGAT